MKRKIYKEMLEWKKRNGDSAFFIDGARRVGKSYIAREFGKNEYKSFVEIDFYLASDEIKDYFKKYKSNLDFLFRILSVEYNVKLYERETLFIFDEVQFCPEARALIKYLVQDGRFDYIETGSLASIKKNVKEIIIPSEEEHHLLNPLDFEEFLWANNEEELFEFIKASFNEEMPLPQSIHRKAIEYIRKYLIVGGMPQAVLSYISNDSFDFIEVERKKKNILDLYKNDIDHHTERNELKVRSIFESIPSQLSKHEKRFNLSSLDTNARFRNYEDSFMWLIDANIINACFNAREPNIGLKINSSRTCLKLYMSDTGLLLSHAFDDNIEKMNEIYKKILTGKLSFNEGMLFENLVAQMLKASGHKLFYYSRNSSLKEERMEIDFLISKNNITSKHNISIIEVKSGESLKATSLKKYSDKYGDYIHKKYIVYNGEYKIKEDIIYLPIYMVSLL